MGGDRWPKVKRNRVEVGRAGVGEKACARVKTVKTEKSRGSLLLLRAGVRGMLE